MAHRRLIVHIVVPVLFTLLILSNAYSSSRENHIRDVRFSSHENFTRIVVECDDEINFQQNFLKVPARLYFDLNDTSPASFQKKEIPVDDAAVKTVKVGRFSRSTTRVVLKLKSYDDFHVYTLDNPHRLVIDISYRNRLEKLIPQKKIVVIELKELDYV